MNEQAIDKVTRAVVKQFPEMREARPSIKSRGDEYLVTYKGSADLPGGKTMKRIVRVVADDRGEIIKLSTSR